MLTLLHLPGFEIHLKEKKRDVSDLKAGLMLQIPTNYDPHLQKVPKARNSEQ
jgi:hypothetical protein